MVPEYTHPEKNGSASFLPVDIVAAQILKLEAKYCETQKTNQLALLMLASRYLRELKGCI